MQEVKALPAPDAECAASVRDDRLGASEQRFRCGTIASRVTGLCRP
ncbi:hypothetical protein HMPREF9622_00517 [Cutibacterium modestum HL037PA3]|uniref:Uncharacterized protein n=1 Tax=Cutibacterium modestum HL044PA1 TaxID=765109 RepID=A0ABP2K9N3_9ACTN|nr:hypothetical protein HMPREF9607_00071 [Cutibacterium modestum HL044PA1]EFT16312.1 hypothetical protein HMPREF9622_00517 [Cutibacterium modestum HL037PA3]